LIPRVTNSFVSVRKLMPQANTLAQSVGIRTRQNRLLVTTDLAGRNASPLPPQILSLRYTGGADPKRLCNRTKCLPCVGRCQSAFTSVLRI